MSQHSNDLIAILKGFGVFCLMFGLLVFICPIFAFITHGLLGRVITNFIFFWPQMALLPYGIINNKIGQSESFGYGGTTFVVAIIFWVVIGIIFSWFTRHQSLENKSKLIYPCIIVITICMVFLMYLLGYSPYVEGP